MISRRHDDRTDVLVARLERRVAFSLSVTDHERDLSIGADNLGDGRAPEPRRVTTADGST